jgi:hypothetical protein
MARGTLHHVADEPHGDAFGEKIASRLAQELLLLGKAEIHAESSKKPVRDF